MRKIEAIELSIYCDCIYSTHVCMCWCMYAYMYVCILLVISIPDVYGWQDAVSRLLSFTKYNCRLLNQAVGLFAFFQHKQIMMV